VTPPLIRLQGLSREHRQGSSTLRVLDVLHLDVESGRFLTVMGPSGAGKTSLLSALGLMDHGWTGRYWFDGRPVHEMDRRARSDLARTEIGFVFQHYHLLEELTVRENIALPLEYRRLGGRERRRRVDALLERFDLAAQATLRPNQLSGGQQQIVAVARALVVEPRLLLADEPTGALHSAQGEQIMSLLAELNRQGTTIVQVTHSETCAGYGHEVLRMRDGVLDG
jgi:ABC-type lipoprotein export system ATPase subunit